VAEEQTTGPTPLSVKGFVDAEKLAQDVSINIADLDNAMIQHSSLAVHYGMNTVNARRQHDRLKSSIEILEATLDARYRESLAEEGKKVTEALISAAVKMDKSWASAQAKLIDAHANWKFAEVAENSMNQRRDMLLEIARDRRKEREGQLRVNEIAATRQSVLDGLTKQ
jgi:hypothetical protein